MSEQPPTNTPRTPDGQNSVAVAEAPAPAQQKPRQLPPWNVVLLDDDEHTYEYVIDLAMRVFAHSREKAFQIAKTVDTDKRAVLLTTHKEHAELKREQVSTLGRDFRMSVSKGSMSCIIEPAFGGDSDDDANANNHVRPRA